MPFQIFVVDGGKFLSGIVDGSFVERIFHLGGIAVMDDDTVVILLTQHIVVEQCFDLAEKISCGKLIQRVVFEVRHEIGTQQFLNGKFRKLIQRTALRCGSSLRRLHPCEYGNAQP